MKKKMNQSRHSSHSRMIRQFSIVFNDDGQRGDLIGTIHCCTTHISTVVMILVFIVMIMALNRLFKVNECGCEASHTLLLCSFLETVDATWPWHVNRFRMKIIFDHQIIPFPYDAHLLQRKRRKKNSKLRRKLRKRPKLAQTFLLLPRSWLSSTSNWTKQFRLRRHNTQKPHRFPISTETRKNKTFQRNSPCVDTALERAKSILLATMITGRDRIKSMSCSDCTNCSTRVNDDLSTTEKTSTNASLFSNSSCNWDEQQKKHEEKIVVMGWGLCSVLVCSIWKFGSVNYKISLE